MKHPIAAAAAALVLATPSFAGMTFEATTKLAASQGGQTVLTEAWVEGDNAKILFRESDNPLFAEGSYLLTSDGGNTLVLVNPQEKTYTPFDIAQITGMAGAALQSMGGMMKMSFTNQQFTKLAEEPGGEVLGHPTTHYRFRTSYDMDIKVMGMSQGSSNESVTDIWTTTALSDGGFSAWLRREPPKTGIAELDAVIANEMATQNVQGVPLKMVTVTTSKDKKNGQVQTGTTTMEVTSLREAAVPAGTFVVPSGFEKVEMMPVVPWQQR